MSDFYMDGFNQGMGRGYLNDGHDSPKHDYDRYSYERGRDDGERRREVSREIDREYFGDDDC